MIPMQSMVSVLTLCLWTRLFLISIIYLSIAADTVFFQTNTITNTPNGDEDVTLHQRPDVYIVGGTPVTSGNSDLYTSFAIPKFDTLFCGAILIWEDVLLSAAHCEGGYNFTTQQVFIGGTTLNGTDAIETNVPVRKAIIHPNYKVASIGNEVENDIMLVFLQRTTNPVIPLAKFNTDPKLPPDNSVVTVIGHGINNRTTNELTYQLNALNMTIVNFLSCDSYYDVLNEDIHLCATGNPTAIAPCEGDSGGPLFYYDTVSNQYIVVGVVSFGFCSFRPNIPSTVYTRISSYPNWILQTICTNSLYPPTKDMCNGIVPLARIPKTPSSPVLSPPTIPTIAPTNSTTSAPTGNTVDETCQQEQPQQNSTTGVATTITCNYLLFFQNRGTYVHRSFLGVCLQKCTIFRNLYLRNGWNCGQC